MSNKFVLVLILVNFLTGLACSPASEKTSNSAKNTNIITNIDPKNLPPGLSASPIPPSANTTPGIPDPKSVNANLQKGATPTPGIPDEKTLKKQITGTAPKGATPTPGIPDPEVLKKQLGNSAANTNPIPPSQPTDGGDRPRTVRKP